MVEHGGAGTVEHGTGGVSEGGKENRGLTGGHNGRIGQGRGK